MVEIIGDMPRDKFKHLKVWCRCECGKEFEANSYMVRSGKRTSCGCLASKHLSEARTRHGQAANETPEYRAWGGMLARCRSKSGVVFSRYGARGIRVCKEWEESFESFFAYIGPRPSPDHSLDRINNDGNYEPGNVRWATKKQQARNKRLTRIIEIDGEKLPLADFADRYGLPRWKVVQRIDRGWEPKRSLEVV